MIEPRIPLEPLVEIPEFEMPIEFVDQLKDHAGAEPPDPRYLPLAFAIEY